MGRTVSSVGCGFLEQILEKTIREQTELYVSMFPVFLYFLIVEYEVSVYGFGFYKLVIGSGTVRKQRFIVFIDNNFFQALSTKDNPTAEEEMSGVEDNPSVESLSEEVTRLDESLDALDELDIGSGEFLFEDEDSND